jgi:hypothetical protein
MAKKLIEKHLETLTLADLEALRKMTKRKFNKTGFHCYDDLLCYTDNEIDSRLNSLIILKDAK